MERTAAGWRVVLFCVIPEIPALIEPLLRDGGHRLVGIVTAPGPRARRSDGYRAIAQLARPDLLPS